MLADEPFSDRPASASPVIAAFLRTYNDGVDDDRRQDLYPLAALIVGTAGSRRLERERASRCLEFAHGLGAGAPTGRGAIGIATAEAAGSWAALAALRAGPAYESHPRALAFVRELVELGAQPRRDRRPTWLGGRDPAAAVEAALAHFEAGTPDAAGELSGGRGAAASSTQAAHCDSRELAARAP